MNLGGSPGRRAGGRGVPGRFDRPGARASTGAHSDLSAMRLSPLTDAHLAALMGWVPDADSTRNWAGTKFRHPFTAATFREDIKADQPSFSLVGPDAELLGFGQYYLRAGRCHLARLIVSPHHRGRGLGAVLVRELCRRGCAGLEVTGCSLFVFSHNRPAVALYRRLGFTEVPYPGEEKFPPDCVYQVTTLAELERNAATIRGVD